MSGARFSPLALRVLRTLTAVRPVWVLCGRSALWTLSSDQDPVTELNLAWHDLPQLGSLSGEVYGRLIEAGMEVTTIRSDFASLRLVVTESGQTCALQLVAEPGLTLETPRRAILEGLHLEIESLHDVFVDRLCDLLEGPDLRDLEDVRRLVTRGGASLERALADAPRKRRGFSPLQLAWNLQRFQIPEVRLDSKDMELLKDFQLRLVRWILASCFPSSIVS